jgi:hypothetical protein
MSDDNAEPWNMRDLMGKYCAKKIYMKMFGGIFSFVRVEWFKVFLSIFSDYLKNKNFFTYKYLKFYFIF